jgi:FAD/FMN-containing dehydrogenase
MISIPSAPHTTSILGNYIPQQGCGCWSAKHGGNETYVQGVEAVLFNGEVIRTGSAAFLHKIWHHRNNLGADLTGLFLGSHGVFGIITKGALGVIPRPEAYETIFLDFQNVSDCYKHINYIAKHELGDYISGQNYMMSLGGLERYPYDEFDGSVACPKEILEEYRKKHNIPPYWFHISLIGSEKVVNARKEELDDYIKLKNLKLREGMASLDKVTSDTDLWAFVREAQGYGYTTGFASRVAQWRGGRMTFHQYAPLSKWEDLVEPGVELMRSHGLECGITFKCIGPYAHSSQLRFVTWYSEKSPEERKMVRDAYQDMAEHSIKNGGTIFRQHMNMEFVLNMEPEFAAFLRRVKDFMDPNHILNPGLLGL